MFDVHDAAFVFFILCTRLCLPAQGTRLGNMGSAALASALRENSSLTHLALEVDQQAPDEVIFASPFLLSRLILLIGGCADYGAQIKHHASAP